MKSFRSYSLIIANAFVILVAIGLPAYFLMKAHRSSSPPTFDSDFRQSPPVYEPYSGYQEATYHSRNLNVERDAGDFTYRENGRPVSPGQEEVFVFGGSTAFGVNVADDQTFPSQLELVLGGKFHVVNFGRIGFSWPEEFTLFNELLVKGRRPKAVVFLDGVDLRPLPTPVADNYRRTMALAHAAAEKFQAQPFFVLQPNRAYGCDRGQYHRPIDPGYQALVATFYEALTTYKSDDFLNFSKLCQGRPTSEYIFIDGIHYDSAFNRELAQAVAKVFIPRLHPAKSRNHDIASNP